MPEGVNTGWCVCIRMMMMMTMMIIAGQKVSIPVCGCIRRVEAVLRIYRFHHQAGTTGVSLVQLCRDDISPNILLVIFHHHPGTTGVTLVHLCRNDISPNIWSVIFHHQVGTTCVFGVILRYILVGIFHQLLVVIFHHKAGTPVHLV